MSGTVRDVSGRVRDSNVYYITPQPAPARRLTPASRVARLRRRLARAWWRLRLTLADISAAIRHPGGRLFSEDDYPLLLTGEVEIFPERTVPADRRPGAAARIIDLGAARLRRRTQS